MGNERTTHMENKETKAKRGISRRNFLTGAAVTGLAAAGALAGCSPKSAAAEADAADGSTKPEHRWQSQGAGGRCEDHRRRHLRRRRGRRRPSRHLDGTFGGYERRKRMRGRSPARRQLLLHRRRGGHRQQRMGARTRGRSHRQGRVHDGLARAQRQPQQPAPHPQLRGLLRPDHGLEHFGNQRSRSRLLQQHRSREPLLGRIRRPHGHGPVGLSVLQVHHRAQARYRRRRRLGMGYGCDDPSSREGHRRRRNLEFQHLRRVFGEGRFRARGGRGGAQAGRRQLRTLHGHARRGADRRRLPGERRHDPRHQRRVSPLGRELRQHRAGHVRRHGREGRRGHQAGRLGGRTRRSRTAYGHEHGTVRPVGICALGPRLHVAQPTRPALLQRMLGRWPTQTTSTPSPACRRRTAPSTSRRR